MALNLSKVSPSRVLLSVAIDFRIAKPIGKTWSGRRNSLQLFDGCDSCLACRVPTHPHFQIEAESLVILLLSFLSLGNREERLPWSSGLPFVVEVLNPLRSDYFSSPSGAFCLQLRKLGTGIYCFSGLVSNFREFCPIYTLCSVLKMTQLFFPSKLSINFILFVFMSSAMNASYVLSVATSHSNY